MLREAATAAAAAARVAAAAVQGGPVLVSDQTAELRAAACAQCPAGGDRATCAVCGCVIAAKTRLATERCPVGVW
jgi:hypothetical protein